MAPGRLGQAIPVDDLLKYLDSMGHWRSERKQELDRIDAAALNASDADSYTSDLTLALTMWQSVSDRLEKLTEVWDSGRVGPQQREEMSRLIWGTGNGLGAGKRRWDGVLAGRGGPAVGHADRCPARAARFRPRGGRPGRASGSHSSQSAAQRGGLGQFPDHSPGRRPGCRHLPA